MIQSISQHLNNHQHHQFTYLDQRKDFEEIHLLNISSQHKKDRLSFIKTWCWHFWFQENYIMCKSDYTEKLSEESKERWILKISQKKIQQWLMIVVQQWMTNHFQQWMMKSNLFTSFSSQSLLLHSIIIHCSSDNSHLMNLSLFSQCFWFEKSKKWRMNIIQIFVMNIWWNSHW
jgi:hypothetical protein